jgi:8-oxo-dGTP diphosphatase
VKKNPTWLLVVAALIRDRFGRLLLQQALAGKPHAGQWEFPGGKAESGENPRFALCREIAEELGLVLHERSMIPAGFADQPGLESRPAIVLLLYACAEWEGEPQSREGQAWGWFTLEDAAAQAMPEIDRTLLEGIAKLGAPPYVAPSKRP